MELFEWLTNLYEIWKNLNHDVVYYSSMTAMGELLKTGCTTCFDHHYLFPQKNSEMLLDSQFRAAKDLGIRMYASRGSMDLSKKDGGLPRDLLRARRARRRHGRGGGSEARGVRPCHRHGVPDHG